MNKAVCNIVRKHLSRSPLYKTSDNVLTHALYSGDWIGWRTTTANIPIGTTHFDVNVVDGVFFLLHIEVAPWQRRQNHGHQLYEILTAIAEELQCDEIRQTPSGTTPRGETRKSYLERRGWQSDSVEVYKLLNDEATQESLILSEATGRA